MNPEKRAEEIVDEIRARREATEMKLKLLADLDPKKKKLIEAFDKLDKETKLKRLADKIEVTKEDSKRFGKVLQRFKKRKKWLKKRREELKETVENGEGIIDKQGNIKEGLKGRTKKPRFLGIFKRRRDFDTEGTKPKRLFGRLREPGRFFSPERIEERHDFRVKVSGNRKWIMIGLAVVAICGTIIYLSVTYGGGGFSFVTKFLGIFK